MSDSGATVATSAKLQQRLISLALGAALMLGIIFAVKLSFDVTQPRSGIDAPSVGATAD
jgi:hypothetical protein